MRKEANTSAKSLSEDRVSGAQGLRSVLSSLLPSFHSKARAALTCVNSKDTGVIGTVPWVLDKCLREDWGSWTTEKRLQRTKMKGGDTPNRPISKPPTDVAGRTMCY